MDELAGTKNRFAVASQSYNNDVKECNSNIRTFLTSMFGFERKNYFKVTDDAKATPTIDFRGE